MVRRPTSDELVLEDVLAARATTSGQGNRSRPRQHGDLAMRQWGPSGKDRSNGCRCDTCVAGARAYKRRHARQRTANHGGGLVALGDVRPHVRRLLRLGWRISQIAEHAQVTPKAVARIARTGGVDDDVHRHVATVLLAVPAVPWHKQHRRLLDEAISARVAAVQKGRWFPDRDPLRYPYGDEWKTEAVCAGLHPESMYPGRGDLLTACRALCAVCPMQHACAEAGLYERFGIWGGLTERQRQKVRRQRGIRLDENEPADTEVAS